MVTSFTRHLEALPDSLSFKPWPRCAYPRGPLSERVPRLEWRPCVERTTSRAWERSAPIRHKAHRGRTTGRSLLGVTIDLILVVERPVQKLVGHVRLESLGYDTEPLRVRGDLSGEKLAMGRRTLMVMHSHLVPVSLDVGKVNRHVVERPIELKCIQTSRHGRLDGTVLLPSDDRVLKEEIGPTLDGPHEGSSLAWVRRDPV